MYYRLLASIIAGFISLTGGALFDHGPAYFAYSPTGHDDIRMDLAESLSRNQISYSLYVLGFACAIWFLVECFLLAHGENDQVSRQEQ
jgi:hypothetical protein